VTRRQAYLLIAACIWTLYVWITRIVIISGQDDSAGFKIVHGVLAAISIAFGLAIGRLGWRARRSSSTAASSAEIRSTTPSSTPSSRSR
jgi:hypothetical protein